jgi:hypothetical protein
MRSAPCVAAIKLIATASVLQPQPARDPPVSLGLVWDQSDRTVAHFDGMTPPLSIS